MKPPVSAEVRQHVLDLRHRHSLRQVADLTGLPLGTVKTICSRSGSFRDNPVHRALFSLPTMREGGSALPVVPEISGQRVITGDNEIDAVLWLREYIDDALFDATEAERFCIPAPKHRMAVPYDETHGR